MKLCLVFNLYNCQKVACEITYQQEAQLSPRDRAMRRVN